MINKNPNSVYTIRFNDCDLFGHLNNSKYLDYFINAREDHLKLFYNFNLAEYYKNGIGWVVRSHEIVYLRPAVYNETVTIQSTLLFVDNESLHVEAIMMNDSQNQLKAIMRTKLIQVNAKTGKKEQHRPEFLEWAKTLENTDIDMHGNLQGRIEELLSDFKERQNS